MFHSLRFELAFVMLFGVGLASWLAINLDVRRFAELLGVAGPEANSASHFTTVNSVLGAAVSALCMIAILRRFGLYPGTPVARSILPVLASCYATFVGIVLFFRVDYSSKILVLAFMMTLLARYSIEALRFRMKKHAFNMVPGGRVEMIRQLPTVPVLELNAPTAHALPAGMIVADLHADLDPEWERFLAESAINGLPVYHYKQVWEAETGRVQIDHLSENSFGALVPNFAYQKIKRAVDLVASIVVMPVVLLLLVGVAIAIKLDGPGPVFFRQRRMGFRGQVFDVLKFRTMTETNDGEDRKKSVTKNDDQRITRIGRFLRRTRLDELPQIVNILRGEMSWIGPRPEAVSLSEWYEKEIPFYRYRHIVRPGITGWAQINQGHVASLDEVDHKLQYDFYYIKHLSYWLDIIIALRTLRVVLSGFGAR